MTEISQAIGETSATIELLIENDKSVIDAVATDRPNTTLVQNVSFQRTAPNPTNESKPNPQSSKRAKKTMKED